MRVNKTGRHGIGAAHVARSGELAGPRKVFGSTGEAADNNVLGVEGPSPARTELAEGTARLDEVFGFRIGLLYTAACRMR